MITLLRTLSAPLISLVFMMMASGLFNTFVSIRLEMEGFSPESIGIVSSASYLGILVGSMRIDRWISKVGHIRAYVVFACVLSVLALAQAFLIDIWYWSIIRFLGGICMAGVFIVIESWMLMQSAPNIRGIVISVYLAIFYAALSSGQLLIDLSDLSGILPFCIAAILSIFSIIPISIKKIAEPVMTETERLGLIQMYKISPLGFIGGIISGMLLAAVYSLIPVYANEVGMSVSQIGTLMAILIFGGFCLQWPLGYIADKSCRRKALILISFATTLLASAIAFMSYGSFTSFFVLSWLFGGFSFALYPISMSYACQNVKDGQIVAATGGFVMSYSLGAIVGPLLAASAMGAFGSSGLFYFFGAITFSLGLIGLKRPAPAILDE
ncbi:MAG: MFS transporter [Chlamydiae bacterium CG10_big_fil_rev_8_21_14_0_10_42_34]|nr:MAG: MFS transporter [Chlamydiae bacterium CG10_big_fil_rev_8_21_14_0_10_42_34]